MTTLMQLSLWVNNIAYDVKTLRFFRIVSFLISLVLGLVGFYSYLMLYQTLLFAYGVHFMALAYTPYVFCALIAAVYHLLTGKRRERTKKAKRILMFSLLPICLMNTWGFITLVTWGVAWVMARLEYNHRKRTDKTLDEAFGQFKRYYRDGEYTNNFMAFSQMMVVTSEIETRYFATPKTLNDFNPAFVFHWSLVRKSQVDGKFLGHRILTVY